MSDMVKRLREMVGWQVGDVPVLIHAAADRIEALEAGLDEIIRNADSRNGAIDIARRTLHGESKG